MTQNTLFVILSILLGFVTSEVTLIKTEKEFKELIKNENALVKFYAPWCGHCKALAPEYVQAAKDLMADKVKDVKMVEVDCTSDKTKEVCNTYEVRGYPTIKYFSVKSQKPLDYEGERKSHGLVSFVKSVLRDAIFAITSQKELDDLVTNNDIVVVEYTEDQNSKTFQQLSEKLRLKYAFASIKDKKLMEDHGAAHETIVLHRTFDDPKLVYKKDEMKLSDWIDHHSFPIMAEMDAQNYRKYFEKNIPVFWVAVDKKNKTMLEKIKSLSSVFKPHREDLFAIYIDGIQFKDALKGMGFDQKLPNAMLIHKEEKYKFRGELNEKDINKFVGDFKNKKLEQFYRSSEAPKKNEGPIFEVVGSTFKDIALDEEHDVVLMYYLTYCQHCKKFKPKYEKLAELFKDEKALKFAKLNGEDNDTPVTVRGYPTVALFPKGNKENPIVYSGSMETEKVEKWLLESAPSLKERGSEKTEEMKSEESKDKKEL